MERNGEVFTELKYCPERFRLNIINFDLVDSKMCKDDISKSLFCDVSKSLRNNDILSNGFSVQATDSVNEELKSQCLDLLTGDKTFVNSDEPMLLPTWNNSDLYDFPSSKKMSLNKFISKDSFINGKRVLAASNGSFPLDNGFSTTKSASASESSLDTNSDSSPETFEENSSSSIEEIFCPILATEVSTRCIAQVESQNVSENASLQCNSDNIANLSTPQEKLNSCIPQLGPKEGGEIDKRKSGELSPKKSGELVQKKDRVMPELIPTLICLDDDEEENSIPSYEEKSPTVVSVADSPEMPKLIPFSADADELLRIKAENLDNKELVAPLKRSTPYPKAIKTQGGFLSDSMNVRCQSVDLQTCTRKLFPDSEVVNVEHFKAKYTKYLSSTKKHEEEVGFSFSASFKCSEQQSQTCGIDLTVKKTKSLKDGSVKKSNILEDDESPQQTKGQLKDALDEANFILENFDSQKSFTDLSRFSNKKAQKKANRLSIDQKVEDADDSISSVLQPKILLHRISLDQCSSLHSTGNPTSTGKITFEHCLPSNDSDDNSLTSRPECDDNSSNEAPEIEEIEGIRFFQFRSKRDMEEFNRKPMVGEIDMEMIVPTKTTDITQIKGWRNKYFATDSQLHFLQSDDGNSRDESSQNAKSVPMLADSTETKTLDFRNCLNDNKTEQQDLKVPMDSNCAIPKSETATDEKPSSALSAFVSKDLDDFLLNSATLNIDLLQKVNPNIIPIPPDATILGLGKFSQPDYELNTLAALKRRNFLNKLKEEKKPPVPRIYSDSDEPVITLSSDDSSSDDDVPVAKLHSGRKRMASSKVDVISPIGSVKRRKSDASLDGASQRVVLRLTKESRGASDGYKVSDISCEKQNSEDSSSSFSPSSSSSEESENEELPDEFKKSADGSSPVIKETIFLKVSEPKMLEEFLNNLNVLGTSNDVAMLVQSNQSYFVKGPVLQSEMCSDALDALLTNKELVDSKNKHTPKKKLKAWQKYLPKKLTKIQQKKIMSMPHAAEKRLPKPEKGEKSTNSKEEKVATSKENVKEENVASSKQKLKEDKVTSSKQKLKEDKITSSKENVKEDKGTSSMENVKHKQWNFLKKVSTIEKPNEKIIKSQLPASNEVPKVRKRRSRSAIELSDSFSFVERGKRSIRLPARYLDSAVLAAGSEWVSPIFVEDDKKTRKQLLDVLDKMTPNKETVCSEETKKDIPKKDEPSPSNQPAIKKISEDNGQLHKATKRQIKTPNVAKKLKIDDVKECIRIKEGSSSKVQSSNGSKNSPEEVTYLLPSCSCSPCSRTMSYKKSTKEFLCFSQNHVPHEISSNTTASSGCIELESETFQKSTLTESVTEPKVQDNSPRSISEGSQSVMLNSIKESEIENKVTGVLEGSQSNKTLPIVPNNPLIPKLPNVTKSLTSKEINISQDSSKKVVFLLPKNAMGAGNSLHNIGIPLSKEYHLSAQKALQLASELRNKPPILTRKLVTENSLSDGVKSPPLRVLTHPPLATSTPNSSPIVFKLPPAVSPQPSTLTQGQLSNNSANVPSNLTLSSLQPSSTPQADSPKPVIKGYKIGNVYFYPSVAGGNEKKSSPMIAYVTNKNPNTPSTSLPTAAASDIKASSTAQTEGASNSNGANEASVSTPPEVPLDHHNYNKKISEHRRKSPLGARVFKESPDKKKKSSSDSSNSDVDVEWVDKSFNPKLVLKKQLANSSGSDASDIECDEIFSTNLPNLIYNGLKKSFSERKRRLLIKKSFERLKVTSPLFNNAKNCGDILNMACFAAKKLRKKEVSLRQAKRVLRLHNAQLLEKLSSEIKGIKETDTRHLLKKRIITSIANDWVKYRQTRTNILSPKKSKKVKDVNASPKVDTVPAIDIESSQTRVVAQQLDFEVEESPKMEISGPPIQFEEASKEAEQPHVQLRILELPTGETETRKELLNLMDAEVVIEPEDTAPAPQENEVNLSKKSPGKNSTVPGGYDGNTSDDDLLIIDLEESATAKASPQKNETSSIKAPSPPPMRKFPGLVPIFPPEFYEENNPFALDLSKFSAETKHLNEDSFNIDSIKNSSNPLSERNSATSHTLSSNPGKLFETTSASEQLIQLAARTYQNDVCDKAPSSVPLALNLSPRNILHRTCKDVKILHGVGSYPDDEDVDDVLPRKVPNLPLPPKIHEEIVIDDSDDEPMDVEQNPVIGTSSESSSQCRPPVTSVIDDIIIEEDSQIQSSFT